MQTRSYRTPDSPYEKPPVIVPPVPVYASLEVGDIVRFTFPEPPTVNRMIKLATARTRIAPNGGKMKEAKPKYWVEQQCYKAFAAAWLDAQGWRPPTEPWQRICIVRAEFHVHMLRDRIELYAGMKWPIDLLVNMRFLENDSPKHLDLDEQPTQLINRANRLLHLWIRRDA